MAKGRVSLDAGGGLGRVVKHYTKKGLDIVGCDFSEVAVAKLKKNNPELDIRKANIVDLPYDDEQFDNLLALGLFHSIESLDDIERGMREAVRCLKRGGHIVASVRSDNLENRLIDFITARRGMKGNCFHKWCFGREEFQEMLVKAGFLVEKCELITNVPFLHKFRWLRKQEMLDEMQARSNGFQLNLIGNMIYWVLKRSLRNSFGTTLVFTAVKI